MFRPTCAVMAGCCVIAVSLIMAAQFSGAAEMPRIVTHDNRTAAGVLKDGVLRVELEIQGGEWYPEAETVRTSAYGRSPREARRR